MTIIGTEALFFSLTTSRFFVLLSVHICLYHFLIDKLIKLNCMQPTGKFCSWMADLKNKPFPGSKNFNFQNEAKSLSAKPSL